MSIYLIAVVASLFLACGFHGTGHAQEIPPPPLDVGDRVRLHAPSIKPGMLGGNVIEMDGDSLVIRQGTLPPHRISWSDVERLDLSEGKDYWAGLFRGAGYTALGGLAAFGIYGGLFTGPGDEYFGRGAKAFIGGVLGSILGAIGGGIGGLLLPPDDWRILIDEPTLAPSAARRE